MSDTLKFIALNLYMWVILCICTVGFLTLNSKSFAPWRGGFSKILKDPMRFAHKKELNQMRKDLDSRPHDFLDVWSIVALVFFLISLLMVITSLLLRTFGS